jgi:hypothetical protein
MKTLSEILDKCLPDTDKFTICIHSDELLDNDETDDCFKRLTISKGFTLNVMSDFVIKIWTESIDSPDATIINMDLDANMLTRLVDFDFDSICLMDGEHIIKKWIRRDKHFVKVPLVKTSSNVAICKSEPLTN